LAQGISACNAVAALPVPPAMQLLSGLHGALTALTTIGSIASRAGGPGPFHVSQPGANGAHISADTPAFLTAYSQLRKALTDAVQQSPGLDGPHRSLGMNRQTFALVFGLASGLSLPFGAWLGVKLSPVLDRDVAAMMAFGAGCLLFAVTVELFAHTLTELEHGYIGYWEMGSQTCAGFLGAYFYVWTNRWLTERFEGPEKQDKDGRASPASPRGNSSRAGFTPEAYQQVMEITQDQAAMAPEPLAPIEEHQEMPIVEPLTPDQAAMEPLSLMKEDGRMSGLVAFKRSNTLDRDPKQRAKQMWKRIRMTYRMRRILAYWQEKTLTISGLRGREKGLRLLANEYVRAAEVVSPEKQKAKKVALALFLGLLIDGVPEGVLMGFLAAEGHLSPVLIISLLVANFPEAFSSASLLVTAGMPVKFILAMWTGLAILVGCLSGLSCSLLLWAYPHFGQPGEELPPGVLMSIAGVEGLTGGAMIACVASVMMPESFERAEKDGFLSSSTGFLTTVGFLVATVLKAVGG